MKNFKEINKKSGAAMLIVVVFFIFISLAVISGLVVPSVREFKIASETINSKKSYFLAESGMEDVVYRLISNRVVGATETITLDSNSATTNVSTVNNSEKLISSLGDVLNYKRKTSVSLKAGEGIVLKYGSQAGRGGLVMGNNAGVYGSMYSNGNIIGQNGSFITGDAFVAEPPAQYVEQSNGESGTPPYDLIMGKLSATQDLAISFQVTEVARPTKMQLYIKKVGTPSYDPYVYILTDYNGAPRLDPTNGYNPIMGGLIRSAGVGSNYDWKDIEIFSGTSVLIPGVTYWLAINCNVSNTDYFMVGASQSTQVASTLLGVYGGAWTNTTPNNLYGYFKIYIGGGHGLISNVDVGSNGTGDANVYELKDSTVVGNAYCKTGSSNNKSCDASMNLPPQEDMPISESTISGWKADAEAGGVVDGDLTISGDQSLGPKKINGNLVVSGTLTLTNTVWVTGNITINGKVKLNPSYLATTGIIIGDKYIYIANNSVFQDSGTSGSYIMLLSTSYCDSGFGTSNPCGAYNAIEVKNNSSLIIANAQKGGVGFQNNAGVKEVVANKIYLANNAHVTYGTGLINVNFTSGTGGAWSVSSWKEVQ